MTDLRGDLHAALRHWHRRPLLPITIAVTLAAGLGTAIGVFAVAWAVLWRPIDVPEPERVVWVNTRTSAAAERTSPGWFAAWQDGARGVAAIAAIRPVSGAFADNAGTDRLQGALVSPSIFSVLRIAPAAGRAFTDADASAGAPRSVLISHHTWQARYGGRADAIGQPISLDGAPAMIVGVLPAVTDALVAEAAWWSPLLLTPRDRQNVGPRYLDVIARLGPDMSAGAARDELGAIAAALTPADAGGESLDVVMTPLAERATVRYAPGLRLLLAAVIVLVLISAVNAAALLATRTQDRAAELAVRASIGATRGRLAMQLLAEIGVLVAVAASGGFVVALWVTDLLRAVLPAELPRVAEARVDGATIAFGVGLAGLVAAVTAVLPALRAAAGDLQPLLRAGGSSQTRETFARRAFVVTQVALAAALSCVGLMLAQSARALEAAPRGYEARGVFTTSITVPAAVYRDGAAVAAVVDRVIDTVASVRGADVVAASSQLPFAGGSAGADVELAERPFTPGVERQARIRLVSPRYLQTVGAHVREGREISAGDTAAAEPVVVINATLARRLGGDANLVGRALKFGVPAFNGPDGRRTWRIAGVADDTWDRGPRTAVEPEVQIALAQTPAEVFFWISRELQLAVRTGGDAAALSRDVRAAVGRVDPAIALGASRTLEDRVAAAFATERLLARLLGVLGFAGVLLALLGLVAIVNDQVRRRHREIAIRVALGAMPKGVVAGITRSGLALAALGVAAGVALSVAAAPLFASLLFGVQPHEPGTLAAAGLTMFAVSAVAAWAPARRAARVDPAVTLRG